MLSAIGVLGIEILLDGLVGLLHLSFSLLFVLRLTESCLIVLSFFGHSFFLFGCFFLVLLLL